MAMNIEFAGLKKEETNAVIVPNTNINERSIDMMQPDFTK